MIALIALIVAGVSLAWNVISTVRGWRKSAPKIDLHLEDLVISGSETAGYLSITAYNHGGSSVAVSEVHITDTDEEPIWGTKPQALRKGQQHVSIAGDPLPKTIEPHHSATWLVDLEYVLFGLLEKSTPIPVRLIVSLSDSTPIREDIYLTDGVIDAAREARRRRPPLSQREFYRSE